MKIWALGLAGISVASISAAWLAFDSPDDRFDIAVQNSETPTAMVAANPITSSELKVTPKQSTPEITLAVVDPAPEKFGSDTAIHVSSSPATTAAAVAEPEYVLCAVWFLGKLSDQLHGVDMAQSRSSHTVPLPGPLWVMSKLREAAG